MPSLKILNVSECSNLVVEDSQVISFYNNLEHLFLSYTNISFMTITSVCSVLDLMVLDHSGIPITTDVCENIIKPCMFSFQVSFIAGQEADLQTLRNNHLDYLIRIV